MNHIVRAAGDVTGIVSGISAASVEQQTGIEQVNQAVTQMDQVTQQNAALVEEAAAAGSLADQAERLSGPGAAGAQGRFVQARTFVVSRQ